MGIDWAELRRGFAASRPFLLSHHRPGDDDHCYVPAVGGRTVRLCARCVGIYPGIVAGVAAFLFAPALAGHLLLVVVLPMPALVDWTLTATGAREGSNPVRTFTGSLLGYGYGLGLGHLVFGRSVPVIAVGVCYGVVAVVLLSRVDTRVR